MTKDIFPRHSFMFYRSFAEALKELPDNEAIDALNGVCAYALDGIEPQLKVVQRLFLLWPNLK